MRDIFGSQTMGIKIWSREPLSSTVNNRAKALPNTESIPHEPDLEAKVMHLYHLAAQLYLLSPGIQDVFFRLFRTVGSLGHRLFSGVAISLLDRQWNMMCQLFQPNQDVSASRPYIRLQIPSTQPKSMELEPSTMPILESDATEPETMESETTELGPTNPELPVLKSPQPEIPAPENSKSGTQGKGVFVALGSNVGNRLENIEDACREMDAEPDIRVVRTSGLYETDPMYVADQNCFLNGACEVGKLGFGNTMGRG